MQQPNFLGWTPARLRATLLGIDRPRARENTHAPYYPARLTTAPFTPALYNTFAIVTRPAARLAPGTRELLAELETHMHALADEFDRSR